MKHVLRKGISLPEMIGIFAMVGVLCGAIVPHLVIVREASQLSKLRFNLHNLRKRIDDYRSKFGHPPNDLKDAFSDAPTEGLPENPISNSFAGMRNQVKKIDSDPPTNEHITKSGMGGWLYNPGTGGVWADHERFVFE